MNQRIRSRKGQAMVEYAMLILVIVGSFSVVNAGILKGIKTLWKTLAKDVAAGCPGCKGSIPTELSD